MILNHVAERAGFLVITAAASYACLFAQSDLDIIDGLSGPDGLEDRVGESEHEDVLDGFFAEVVVDPEQLVLVCMSGQDRVQLSGRSVVVSERLFNDNPIPERR